jgi:hypothetical protein
LFDIQVMTGMIRKAVATALIVENHLDKFSDNGEIYERSRDELKALKESVSEGVWAEAVVIAHRRWGQQ